MRRASGQQVFVFVIVSCVQFVVLTLLAMFFFPGGTLYDSTASSYSFFGNFFSELGLTLTYYGRLNTVSAVLFTFSLTVLGIGIAAFFVAVQHVFGGARAGRGLLRAGSVFGIAAGLSFIGVAATPANKLLGMHVAFLCIAFPAILIASSLHAAAILRGDRHLRSFGEMHAAAAVFMAGYLALVAFGPRLNSTYGVKFQATAQKAAVYPAMGFLIYQSLAAIRLVAAAHGASSPYRFVAASKIARQIFGDDRSANAELVKKKALELGADKVGICRLNRKWLSTKNRVDDYRPVEFSSVVVIAVNMDPECFQDSPSRTIVEESRRGDRGMENVAGRLARFIAAAGYNALPAGNGDAVSVPQAVEAGMGRLGRNGMLLTEEAGSCLRLCKVFTDAPVEPDEPPKDVNHEFCRVCFKCAEACPADAIEDEPEPSDGVWRVDIPLCDPYWKKMNKECAACITACPFTWRNSGT
jgi:ferredoxin